MIRDDLEDKIKIFTLFGLFETRKKQLHYVIDTIRNSSLKLLVFVNCYAHFVGGPVYAYNNSQNKPLLFKTINNILAMYGLNVNLALIYFQNEKLRDLVNSMRNMYEAYPTHNEETKKIVLHTEKLCSTFTVKLPTFLVTIYLIGAYGTMLYLAQQNCEEIEEQVTIWYPFDVCSPFIFHILVVSTPITIACVMIFLMVIIALIASLMLHTLAQFKILNYNLQNLRKTALENVEKKIKCLSQAMRRGEVKLRIEDEVPLQDFPDEELSPSFGDVSDCETPAGLVMKCKKPPRSETDSLETGLPNKRKLLLVRVEMERLLGKCVDHHCDIIRFVRKFEAFFNILFGLIAVCNLTINVLIMVSPSMVTNKVSTVMLAPRLLYFFIQLALFCLLADEVADESARVGVAISACDWLESSDSFKKSMRVVISMANQPVIIKTAGFLPLSGPTITSVIKTAFSYYTVLSEFT